MKVVFFGTPDIAVPTLQALAGTPQLRPAAVFTQPAARRARRGAAESSEVALAARALGIVTHEVESVNEGDAFSTLQALAPEVIVVVSFGQILKKRVLELPRFGCLNFHPSALPKYRGAAPIQRAVIAGERISGLTIMRLVKKLDAGPILAQEPWEIGDTQSAEQLMAQAGKLGAPMMRNLLLRMERGEEVVAREQDESQVSFAPPLSKDEGRLDFRKDARQLCDLVRGVQPWPRAEAFLEREKPVRVIVHEASVVEQTGAPGAVLAVGKEGIVVGCGRNALCLARVQLEGKSVKTGRELANGLRLSSGTKFSLPEHP